MRFQPAPEHRAAVIDNQCKDYASHIREEDRPYTMGEWGSYKVPFIFATNGRPYIEQFKEKSGIWMQDLRGNAIPKALRGWPAPEGIEYDLSGKKAAGEDRLRELPRDFLTDKDGLNLRDYQVRAVAAAEQAVEEGKDKILLAMATGTGKTRTVLGLMYRFLKSGRFRRILYLVDRNALGNQVVNDVFDVVKLDGIPLSSLYNIKTLEDQTIDPETRVHVSTVQGMVRRILYSGEKESMPAISDYDLVIIDEAHRGYILDKEMTETEVLYRDQRDFQSTYHEVVEYFDAVKIALTATPAQHTTQIFGHPVFRYTYRDAVNDGYLADFDAPHIIRTELSTNGIHYKKDDELIVFDHVTGEIITDNAPDELDYDVDDFNVTR